MHVGRFTLLANKLIDKIIVSLRLNKFFYLTIAQHNKVL